MVGDREALVFVGVDQRGRCAPRYDEGELPRKIIGILQPGVHALPAHRTMDVRRVAQKETTAVVKPSRAPVMDAGGGKPVARLERKLAPHLLPQRGNRFLERQALSPSQLGGQAAHYPPVIRSRHWDDQVKSAPP